MIISFGGGFLDETSPPGVMEGLIV
jgi:hypothetical protein